MNTKTIAAALLIATTSASSMSQTHGGSPLAPPMFTSTSATPTQAKQFRLGKLTFTGNTHTKEFVIRRMISLTEGDIFNQSLWEVGLEQINRSGLFEPIQQNDVVMKPDDAMGLIEVALHLKARNHQ